MFYQGTFFRGLESIRAHETLIEHKEDSFLLVAPERIHWGGSYGGKDVSRGETNRIGARHNGLGVRWKEIHTKHADKKISTNKYRQEAKDYSMHTVSGYSDSRRGHF